MYVTEQNPIHSHGFVSLGDSVIAAANSVRHQNNKVNTPSKFHRNKMDKEEYRHVREQIATFLGVSTDDVDYTYFACASGADEHVDSLDPTLFTNRTIVVPVIVPETASLIVGPVTQELRVGVAYEIDHTKPHTLAVVGDTGCVVIMATIRRSQDIIGRIPHDYLTHHDSWREAIARMRDNVLNEADKSYWDHELRAYDRAHAWVKRQVEQPMPEALHPHEKRLYDLLVMALGTRHEAIDDLAVLVLNARKANR